MKTFYFLIYRDSNQRLQFTDISTKEGLSPFITETSDKLVTVANWFDQNKGNTLLCATNDESLLKEFLTGIKLGIKIDTLL